MWGSILLLGWLIIACGAERKDIAKSSLKETRERPNFLFIISDDQSWNHVGAYGDKAVTTPYFDSLAHKGILFENAFCVSPHCSVSRATLLTGMNQWQLEEAGTHSSGFPAKFEVFPDILEKNGYKIGYTGKGWGPGNWKDFGRYRNPAGIEYNKFQLKELPARFLGKSDAAENFKSFLNEKEDDVPFWFWYGSKEPHVPYKKGIGLANGIDTANVKMPSFLPDTPESKGLMADYYFEIEWFDQQLGRLLEVLEETNNLENTVIVVTSDNGIILPRAKRNLYEMGVHVPLVVHWEKAGNNAFTTQRLTSFIDIAPTILDLAGIDVPPQMVGNSFTDLFQKGQTNNLPKFVITGFERHDHRRFDNLGYPVRAIRTDTYLLLKNYQPDRWPEGNPKLHGYGMPSEPNESSWTPRYSFYTPGTETFDLAFAKRPELELYNIQKDPDCAFNLLGDNRFLGIADSLYTLMKNTLVAQGDPRELGFGSVFESYPRYGSMKENLKGFKERGKYNPKYYMDVPEKK
ncbi:MAG: sulfatase [Bacteroidota bacterium]